MSMTLIEHIEVGSGGAASISFTSIPQTFTDLVIVASLRDARAIVAGGYTVELNGTSASSSSRFLEGNGSSAVSGTAGLFFGNSNGTSSTADTFSSASIYISNYTSSTGKSVSVDSVNENNATSSFQALLANLWNNTAAITSVTFTGVTFQQYSSATLYGITAGSDGTTTVS